MNEKIEELLAELRTVMAGRGLLLDAVLPPLIFLLLNGVWGRSYGMMGAVLLALLICLLRFRRGESLRYAAGGLAGVLLASLLVRLFNSAEAFYLPGLISGGLTVLLCGISLIAGRPLAAWSSLLTRRWPREWYWHARVRPAYSEVTFAWLLFFLLRLLPQLFLFGTERAALLGLFQLVTGWPGILLLLIGSYLYGSWRLRQLAGPSVEEFRAGTPPPWQSQQRGF